MQFCVDKNILNEAVRKVSRAISSNPIAPILSGVLLIANEEGLSLTGSDSNISVRTKIPIDGENGLEIEQAGGIVLPTKELSGIVKTMPEDLINFELNDLKVVIKSGKSVFNLNGIRADEYPNLPNVQENHFSIQGKGLNKLFDRTGYAVSKFESRPILTGVNLFFEQNVIGAVSTDSHRLARIVTEEVDGVIPEESITIPDRTVKEIPRLIDDADNVNVGVKGNQIIFKTDDLYIVSRLLEGNYPETNRLIPTEHNTEIVVNRQSFLASMERSKILADNDTHSVAFEISNKNKGIFETIKLLNRNSELGESKEEIIVEEIEGDELTISFSTQYMIDALNNIEDDKVVISFSGPMRPFILRPIDDDKFIQLVLPVRTF